MGKANKTVKKSGYLTEMLKALVLALIITLVLLLLGSLLVMLLGLSVFGMTVINQVIKGLSIFISALVCFRLPNNGWVRGLFFGILYIVLSELVLAIFNNGITFDVTLLTDLSVGCVTGMISGIIAVNLIRPSNRAAV